jgi:transposase InsO family protein
MRFHRNAKLGLAGRRELVLAIASGSSIRRAAVSFHVSPATAHRWWRRWCSANEVERGSLACLLDRSSRPARSPRRLAPRCERAICDCRRKTGWGPRLVAGATGFSHSTVWKVLRRFGLSRPAREPRAPANRYEWPCPGDLLHLDVSRYARFLRPGHRVTGDRSQRARKWMRPETRVGYDFVHAVVDDRSRLAYAEIHGDERAATCVAFFARALAFFAAHGIQAKRVMTDNAFAYVHSRAFRDLLDRHGIRHLTTEPYRPRTNGKVERFHQTMAREWAYGVSYRSHHERNRALPHWLEHYNHRRPHSSLGGQPPLSRVHNVRGKDT